MSFKVTLVTVLFIGFSLMVGCSSEDENSEQAAVIPEYLQGIENLTVFPSLAEVEPDYSIRFEKEATFESVSQVIAVDDSDRVYSSSAKFIKVYASDGTHLQNMGRQGSGPGEFQRLGIGNLIYQTGRLYTYDDILQRYNVYSTDTLLPVDEILMNISNWNSFEDLDGFRLTTDFFVRNDNTALVGFRESMIGDDEKYKRFYLMDLDGIFHLDSGKIFEHVDVNYSWQAGPPVSENAPIAFPFTRSNIMAVSDEGFIYSAWTDDFLIEVFSPDGLPLRAFYYPYEKSTLNPGEIFELYEGAPSIIDRIEELDFPDTWPALDQIILDDENQLWISTITDSNDEFQWWVLDQDGKLLAQFTWPEVRLERHMTASPVLTVKNGYLYVKGTNFDVWSGTVEKYRIVMEKD